MGTRRCDMADDLEKRGPQDRTRIGLMEPYEVQYWADKFGVRRSGCQKP